MTKKNLVFIDDDYPDDEDIPEIFDDKFDENAEDFGIDLDESENSEEV